MNAHVVNFYRWLKRGLTIPFEMVNDEAHYYRARAKFNELLASGESSGAEAAGLFYYLNRTGYNGLCRFNRKGEFNVPFGRYKTIEHKRDFLEYQPALANWDFSNVDFESLELNAGDFIYADPPYDVEFRSYATDGFSWADQVRTAAWLSRHPGPVILCNQATPEIVDLYRDFRFDLKFLDAPRRISCNGDRSPAQEVLAFRNI